MNGKQRFLLGGCGGLTPLMVTFAVSDVKTIAEYIKYFSSQDTMALLLFLGYVLKIFFMFSLGGMWAWLHTSEKNLVKIFQLGIVAPAILSGALQAKQVVEGRAIDKNVQQEKHETVPKILYFVPSFVSNAFAGEVDLENKDIVIASVFDKILDGFLGRDIKEVKYRSILIAYNECLSREPYSYEVDNAKKNWKDMPTNEFKKFICGSDEGKQKGCEIKSNGKCKMVAGR